MNFVWYGQSCFQLSSSQAKNNDVSIVIDPFEENMGLKLPRKLEADIVLVSHDHPNHNNVKRVSGSPFVITGPGEYGVKEIFIQGIPANHDKTIYTVEAEEIKVCHLAGLSQKELTPDQLERIGEVDILMLPVGGTFTIDAKEAIKVMTQIEPKITIPMHYKIPGLKLKLDGVDKFLKSLGIKQLESLPKLSIKKKDISSEEAKIIVLEPQ